MEIIRRQIKFIKDVINKINRKYVLHTDINLPLRLISVCNPSQPLLR